MQAALIFGINGQDGSYLSEFLLAKNYKVFGLIRRSSNLNTQRLEHMKDKIQLFYGDVLDLANIVSIINTIKDQHPQEFLVFSLAAMSHVKISFELPIYTAQVNAIGTLNILEAIRMCGLTHLARFYQASTTELYGRVLETPQTETTPFYPLSPYATSKLFAYWITRNYRESYGMYAVNGILSNHESSRRSFNFVTRKITLGVGRIFNNEKDYILTLGNLDALRDWCSSRDCVRAMWLMLQQPAQPSPKDYVIGSGENHSVREFVEICFRKRGFDLEWKGQGLNEQGIDKRTGRILVQVNEKFMRPNEVDNLLTDPSLAHRELGWKPEITFDELIDEMLDVDCPRAEEPELE